MPVLKIAHIREQEQDMIIVPLDETFDARTHAQQSAYVQEIQARSASAGLAGTVVPVWLYHGQMKFIAPRPWHPFFQGLDWNQVAASINKELRW